MKKNYLLLLLLSTFIGFAQVPAGYYDTATGSGYTLKTQLYNIIKGHTDLSYNGLWTTYQTSDRDNIVGTGYENDNTIYDLYSENPNGVDPYTYIFATNQCGTYTVEGQCYNREHIIPQSVFGSLNPMVSDAHFITPTDGKVNAQRADFPHGTVTTTSWTSLNGSKLGTSAIAGYTGSIFEPVDAFKGDIARMYLYFATRYENVVAGYNFPMFNNTSDQVIASPFLRMLLDWHIADPVSQREIDRNNAIYARQGNRNPYIDHPEYVAAIWSVTPDFESPTAASQLAVTATNPYSVTLNWTAGTDNIGITRYEIYVDGVYNSYTSSLTKVINGLLPSTTYNFYVIAKDGYSNVSPQSNAVSGTTNAPIGVTCASENFETIPATSAFYTVNTWTNGGITWTATDSRVDQTISARAILVRNGSLTGTALGNGIGDLIVTTQLKFGGSAGTFKVKVNGVEVGTIPYSAIATTTAIPNINVTGNVIVSIDSNSLATNRVAFDNLTWQCYAPLEIDDFDENAFKIYPNPSDGNLNINFENNGEYALEVYSQIGQKVFEVTKTATQSIAINNLTPGVYMLKIIKENKSIVKKIVIN
jgi:endonuclease I